MIEYISESRIDGYPILKVPKNEKGDEFLEYLKTKDILLQTIKALGEKSKIYLKCFSIIKVIVNPIEYKKLYTNFERKEKLIKINEYKKTNK